MLGLVLALAVGVAQAASDVKVVRSTFESGFPQTMTFQLDATTARVARQVTLNYRIAGRRTIFSGKAQVAQAGGTLRALQQVELARRYLPPGSVLQFFWELEDDQGDHFRSEMYQATLDDRRFTWRQIRIGNVELNWSQGEDAFGRTLIGVGTRTLTMLAQDTGATLERSVRVFVYADIEQFRSASYRGGLEWVGGTFYPQENVVLIYAPPTQEGASIGQRALAHELTHAVIQQVSDSPFGDVPQWLNEGLASRSEPFFSPSQADALAKASAQNTLLPLRAISGSFPVDSNEALLAYAESYSAASFVMERYGRQRVNLLLRGYRDGITHDEGLQQALGVDMTELDREWRAWLMPWPLLKATPFSRQDVVGATPTPTPLGIIDSIRRLTDSIWRRDS